MTKLTQKDRILNHLRVHGRITPLEALHSYGCFRLAATIHRLREDGWQINTKIKTKGRTQFAVYSLGTPARVDPRGVTEDREGQLSL